MLCTVNEELSSSDRSRFDPRRRWRLSETGGGLEPALSSGLSRCPCRWAGAGVARLLRVEEDRTLRRLLRGAVDAFLLDILTLVRLLELL